MCGVPISVTGVYQEESPGVQRRIWVRSRSLSYNHFLATDIGFASQRCLPEIAYRTEVFDNANVKGSEFLRKVKAIARRNKLTYRWVAERGSGSHGTLYVGTRFTVVKDLKKELGPGLLSDMLKQLGIRKEDL
jgi:mRNA interferase HicA